MSAAAEITMQLTGAQIVRICKSFQKSIVASYGAVNFCKEDRRQHHQHEGDLANQLLDQVAEKAREIPEFAAGWQAFLAFEHDDEYRDLDHDDERATRAHMVSRRCAYADFTDPEVSGPMFAAGFICAKIRDETPPSISLDPNDGVPA